MFGWWVPPHCKLCRFDGEVCKKQCSIDKGCYVDECGKITTKGCCEVELQLFENRIRKKCLGSPPGCNDGGRIMNMSEKGPMFYLSYHNQYLT